MRELSPITASFEPEVFSRAGRLPDARPWLIRLAATLGLVSCTSQRDPIALPPASPPPSVLESYSLEELLIQHEGMRLKPYVDSAKKLTIGIGRNLSDNGISEDEAMYLLHHDVNRVFQQLDTELPWWRGLSETRQKVMVSMVFNLGMSGLLEFHDMLSAIEDSDYSAAAGHMLASRWATQVGRRAIELAYLMEHG